MPSDADLIRIVFASGTTEQNRALIDKVAALRPELPMVVVAEFEPARGEWVAWHVMRAWRDNLAAVRACIGSRAIESAHLIFDAGVPVRTMARAATAIARRGRLFSYDERLRTIRGAGWIIHPLRRFAARAASPRTKKWLRRIAHPGEAEIPVRARAAQAYGIIRSRLRRTVQERVMPGKASAVGVSVVIPSRNGRELLEILLPTIAPQMALTPGEILVCDNGSDDGTAQWLSREYPAVVVVRSAEPLSFARAVNAGIRRAQFSRTLLLNNDMIVEPGFISALAAAFESVPDLFCSTAQIFFPAGRRREETGKAVWRRDDPTDFPVRCDHPIAGEDLTWVLYGSGGCSMYDAAKLRALGGVSESFDPAYVEDLDLGYRAWKRGWPSVYCDGARVEHRHRATTSRYYTPESLAAFLERNYLEFLIHAIGSPALFRRLWLEAIRRLQLRAMAGEESSALDALRHVPRIDSRSPHARAILSETEILALGSGDIAVFPGVAARDSQTVVIASPFVPFPLSHGGAVRIYNLMKHIDHDLVLVAFTDELSTPPAELLSICREVILVRRHGSHYRRNTPLPDVVEEFASECFRACLKQTVSRWRPAIVQLEFTQMAQYAESCREAKTILVEHDITFDLQRQLLATTTEAGPARLELQQQLAKWKSFETAAWSEVDCVVTVSAQDSAAVKGAKHVASIPNGVDADRFEPSDSEPEGRRLLFIGSFAHLPNLLALEYFLNQVWPLLHNGRSRNETSGGTAFTLHVIAGSRPDYFMDFYKSRVSVDVAQTGIELEGFVSDVRDAYRRAELVLAPLTASAGTNIKVLEAMAMGRVVISTPAGVNGLDIAPDRDVIITNSSKEMATRIIGLSSDRNARKSIEERARQTALRYDWKQVAQAQASVYRDLAGASAAQ